MGNNKKYTLDNNTKASNPGEIVFDYWIWLRHNTLPAIAFFSFLPIFIVLSIKFSFWFLIGLAISVLINLFYWIRAKEHFSADSNPGLIVSVLPPLYAVYTDLTKGLGHYPVIKIQHYKGRGSINVGDKIATVAVYADGEGDESPCWSDFFPLPVEYATDDLNSIQSEMNSYSDEDWRDLTEGLNEISKIKDGLFKLKTADSDW